MTRSEVKIFRVGDIVVIAVLAVAAVALTIATAAEPAGKTAVVLVDGHTEAVLHLEEVQSISVHGPLGDSIVETDGEGVRIIESPCPHKTCMRMGRASITGQVLVCAPNRVAVRVEGGAEEDGVDGVTG